MIIGYHTVEDRNNPDLIKLEGPFRCEREDAWLGHGYYFWDTNIHWAHNWGRDAYRRKGYIICQAKINPDIMFDLVGNIGHQMEFEEMIKLLEADESYQREKPLVAEIIDFMKDRGFFAHKSVRAADNPYNVVEVDFRPPRNQEQPNNRPFMRIGQRVQICLFEKSELTLHDFSIIFPDNYME
jgi:hypothetical protein